jgi:Ca2+-binding EF-hand superfamily protein
MLIQFAENLFDMWDPDRDGYMYGDKLAECVCSLGLAHNQEFVIRLMSIMLKRQLNKVGGEKVNKEEFTKLTHSSRLVNRILKIINEATKNMC